MPTEGRVMPTEGRAGDLFAHVAELEAGIAGLRSENARLEAELAQLRQSAEAVITRLCEAVEAARGRRDRALADTDDAVALAYRAIGSAGKFRREGEGGPS